MTAASAALIQLIDSVECGDLERSIVKPKALTRAVLVQDAAERDSLFALLFVDERRAVLVRAGNMNFDSTGGGRQQLLRFRNELDRANVSAREFAFCLPGTYSRAWDAPSFDSAWFTDLTFADLVARFVDWRAGRAEW